MAVTEQGTPWKRPCRSVTPVREVALEPAAPRSGGHGAAEQDQSHQQPGSGRSAPAPCDPGPSAVDVVVPTEPQPEPQPEPQSQPQVQPGDRRPRPDGGRRPPAPGPTAPIG